MAERPVVRLNRHLLCTYRPVRVRRSNRNVTVGWVDLSDRRYQFGTGSTASGFGSIEKFLYKGALSIGRDEWDSVEREVDRVDFVDNATARVYSIDLESADLLGVRQMTYTGRKVLVPLEAFDVLDFSEALERSRKVHANRSLF